VNNLHRLVGKQKGLLTRSADAKANYTYSKDLKWKEGETQEGEEGEEDEEAEGTFEYRSPSSYYRKAQLVVATIMHVSACDIRHFKEVMEVILRNPRFKEAARRCGMKALDGEMVKKQSHTEKLLGRLTEIFTYLKDKHHEDIYRIPLQVLTTCIARPDEAQYGSYMKWLCENLNVGEKSMQQGYLRAVTLAASDGEEGFFYSDKRAIFQSKAERHPLLAELVENMWASEPISKISPNMKDWCYSHLPGEDVHKSKTHEFQEVEGKMRRHCVKGLKEWNGDGAVTKEVLKEWRGWRGAHCVKARIYHQMMSNQQAYDEMQRSEQWKNHVQQYPDDAALLTFSFVRSCKPDFVKPNTRDTSQCVHHMSAKHIAEDWRNGGKDAQGKHVHELCGGAGGCQCEMCKEGKCRTHNAFYREEFDRPQRREPWAPLLAMSLVRDELVCDKKSFKCISGQCKDCKDKVLQMVNCPLEMSEEKMRVRCFTYEAAGSTVAGFAGVDDDDEEGE
jgi:hypothetical protein